MTIPSQAFYLVKKYEGYSSKIYICPAGYQTIGYGHLIKNYENIPEVIDQEPAYQLLTTDLLIAAANIKCLIRIPLNQNQFASLLSFTFNLGGAALERSTLRQKINREDFEGATSEFCKWIYVGAKILPGLVKRRAEERDIFTY